MEHESYTLPSFDNADSVIQAKKGGFGEVEPEALSRFQPDYLTPEVKQEAKSRDYSLYSSDHFIQEDSLLSNIEEYSNKIKSDADKYASRVRKEADLMRSEIELALANALGKQQEAKENAETMAAEAKAHRDDFVAEGKAEGFEAGFAEGEAKHKEQNDENTANVLNLTKELSNLKISLLQEYEQQIVDMVTLMAQKVTHQQLSIAPDTVLEMIKDGISRFEGMGKVKLRLHPDEYEFVLKHQGTLSAFLDEDQSFSIQPDAKLAPHAPMIESNFAVVNLDMNKQFDEIRIMLDQCAEDRRELFQQQHEP